MAVTSRIDGGASDRSGAGDAPPDAADVVVVGAGVIGLASAWRLARGGRRVVVFDPDPGRGASWAAAGMLAPVTELHYGEEALLALNLASAQRWSAFAADLQADAAHDVGYRATGTLLLSAERGDRAWAEELFRFQRELGLEAQWLAGARARELEPNLAPGVLGGLWAPGDHQVDNRRLLAALLTAARLAGVTLCRRRVAAVDLAAGAVAGVTLDGGAAVAAPAVVLAAGCRTGEVGGLPPGAVPPVRPVKGQILRLAAPDGRPLLTRTVRGLAAGSSVYLVPRIDGSLVVGATVEERGFDETVTAGGVYELLRDAHRFVPGVTELVLAEATAGLRPGSPDNRPAVGAVGAVPGLVVAAGHHRNGMLLAPLTADAVVAAVSGGTGPAALAGFAPDRFASAAAGDAGGSA